jgi:hypothetical protein
VKVISVLAQIGAAEVTAIQGLLEERLAVSSVAYLCAWELTVPAVHDLA